MYNFNNPSGIQIIGTQRSGSNLLRVILDQSPLISSPHPPHILVTFVPLLRQYGRLDASLYKMLIQDVVDYVEANPVPWSGIRLDPEWIFENSSSYSIFEINKLIYQSAAISKHALYWCCKSMANVHFAAELQQHSPDLKYIYLYRDGRDVALSFKKAIVGEKHIHPLATQWYEDQVACLDLSERVGSHQLFSLSYESLIENPERVVPELCEFLNIDFSNNMLQYYKSEESKATAAAGEMWENLEKPIIKDNAGKFLRELSGDEIEIFELINHDVLRRLGYSLFSSMANKELISKKAIEIYAKENNLLKLQVIRSARESDVEKRAPQIALLKRIKEMVPEENLTIQR
jgi:hypothetical protein